MAELTRALYLYLGGLWAACTTRIVPDRIYVSTFDDLFSCNPKYIVLELLRRQEEGARFAEIVWAVKDPERDRALFPEKVKLVRRGSMEQLRAQAGARVWLDNGINCCWTWLPKRRGQYYIDTWHGSYGIKKITGGGMWRRRAMRCGRIADLMLANSAYEEDVFRNTFWPRTEFLRCGHPRDDMFFDEAALAEAGGRLRKRLGLSSDTRLVLYAPTFRDSGEAKGDGAGPSVYSKLCDGRLVEALAERFGGTPDDWVILLRPHPLEKQRGMIDTIVSKASVSGSQTGRVIDVSDIIDMQEIISGIDVGISDYSSWSFDFMLTRRPMLLYTYDLDDYDGVRGFNYPIEEAPFPLCRDMESLLSAIREYDDASYRARVDSFLRSKVSYDDGHATEHVVDVIMDVLR